MSSNEHISNRKIDEALKLLREAAQEKKCHVEDLLGKKYTHLKDAFLDATAEGKEGFSQVREAAGEAIAEGEARLKEVASDVDLQVRQDPWLFIGAAAVGALFLGYLLGSAKKEDK